MTAPPPKEPITAANEAGRSTQRRYDQLSANDAAERKANRGRRMTSAVVWTVIVTAATWSTTQVANSSFDAWQASLPGQTPGTKMLFPPSTAALITVVFTLATAAKGANRVWGRRQTTENYRIGAEGERATANWLAPLTVLGYILLHDRVIPGRRENIDHIAIGPNGVAVVDAKKWTGRALVTADTLKFNGRDKAGILAQLARQATAVDAALSSAGLSVEVRKVVCFHRAEIERRGSTRKHPARPDGVRVCGPRQLAETVSDGPVLFNAHQITQIAGVLERAFRPAT